MKPTIYAIGESILDIIFKNGEVQTAKPGGSMLNSSVSLGRIGMPVKLISEVGKDFAGKLISDFLENNNVGIDILHDFTDGKTALAMASIDEKGDASYDFYKFYPENRLETKIPHFYSGDFLLFGSYFGIDPKVYAKVRSIAQVARNQGALLVYDPNFRKSHLHEIENLRPVIVENMRLAHIVRASDEDLRFIFGTEEIEEIMEKHQLRDRVFIKTCNQNGIYVYLPDGPSFFVASTDIVPICTIGAGDNFNAGLLAGLYRKSIHQKNIYRTRHEGWQDIIALAISFATEVCLSYENYISEKFAFAHK